MHNRFSILCPLRPFADTPLNTLLLHLFYALLSCELTLTLTLVFSFAGFILGREPSRMLFQLCRCPFLVHSTSFLLSCITNVLFRSAFVIMRSPIRAEIVTLSFFVSPSFGSTMPCTWITFSEYLKEWMNNRMTCGLIKVMDKCVVGVFFSKRKSNEK